MSEGRGGTGIHFYPRAEQDSEGQIVDRKHTGSSLSPAKAQSHHQRADADLRWARERHRPGNKETPFTISQYLQTG